MDKLNEEQTRKYLIDKFEKSPRHIDYRKEIEDAYINFKLKDKFTIHEFELLYMFANMNFEDDPISNILGD